MYLFLQDITAGTNPVIPPNLFRVNGASHVGTGTGVEQNLTKMQVTYAGMGFTGSSNLLTQMYMHELMESRRNGDPGSETMDQWLQRGPCFGSTATPPQSSRQSGSRLEGQRRSAAPPGGRTLRDNN